MVKLTSFIIHQIKKKKHEKMQPFLVIISNTIFQGSIHLNFMFIICSTTTSRIYINNDLVLLNTCVSLIH